MIDIIILNRNLGRVCDNLVESLGDLLGSDDTVTVVDAGSRDDGKSVFTSVESQDDYTREFGLRFGRGMNLGLEYREQIGNFNPWILMMPVDTEIVSWNPEGLISEASKIEELVAVKPLESTSAYAQLLPHQALGLAWNLEEGPWMLRSSFVQDQRRMSPEGDFFDRRNFRGYLTSLELSFRAYANGLCVGVSSHMVLRENESYLLDRAQLIGTEPIDINRRLMVSEGLSWLKMKYSIDDAWSFAQVVRLLFQQFLEEHPEYSQFDIQTMGWRGD